MDGLSQRRHGQLVTSSSAPSQQARNDGPSIPSNPPPLPTLLFTLSRQKLTERDSQESWVEIASQPSSSSLSSIGDEIVTTGLRVAGSYPPRRRRTHPVRNSYPLVNPPPQAGGASSQEEYEASESEDDRALASSAEHSPPTQIPSLSRFEAPVESDTDSEYDDDDDENATALGSRGTGDYVFRPEPNAFSNPPSNFTRRRSSAAATTSAPGRSTTSHRSQTRVPRQPDYMSPAYQADNDAALRASLTTLLSCAAAARGLNKNKEEERHGPSPGAAAGTSNQPMELRLVPESDLVNESPPRAQAAPASPRPASSSPSSARSPSRSGKSKRGATTLRGARASKKKKTATEETTLISPTIMTWVVSTGVVVLVSVIGFGAGYVIGREVGRQEMLGGTAASVNASDSGCGREVMRSSVKRLKLGSLGRTAVMS